MKFHALCPYPLYNKFSSRILHKVCTRLSKNASIWRKKMNLKYMSFIFFRIWIVRIEKNHYGYNYWGLCIHIDIIYTVTDSNYRADLVFYLSIVWRKIRFKKDIFSFYFEEIYGFETKISKEVQYNSADWRLTDSKANAQSIWKKNENKLTNIK